MEKQSEKGRQRRAQRQKREATEESEARRGRGSQTRANFGRRLLQARGASFLINSKFGRSTMSQQKHKTKGQRWSRFCATLSRLGQILRIPTSSVNSEPNVVGSGPIVVGLGRVRAKIGRRYRFGGRRWPIPPGIRLLLLLLATGGCPKTRDPESNWCPPWAAGPSRGRGRRGGEGSGPSWAAPRRRGKGG